MTQPVCELCGEPMPPGEEMFKIHGYSGNCPKPPKARTAERTEWRMGLAVTPKMRMHPWFQHLGVVRRINPETESIRETIMVEIYHGAGEETTVLLEPSDDWMTG